MTIDQLKSKLETIKQGLDEKKSELLAHFATEETVEGEEAIAAFDAKTSELTAEITLLEETASKEYAKFKAAKPLNWDLSTEAKSNGGSSVDMTKMEEMFNSLNVKSSDNNAPKKSAGTYIADALAASKLNNHDDLQDLQKPLKFTFQLDSNDAAAYAEVKSATSIKSIYSNNGVELVSGTPVPGFQGYGCTIFEVSDECQPCIEPRNFGDFLTVRNMPTGNVVQYEYPVSRDDNAAGVLESVYNPYPTVIQAGLKPESTFTYNTAKVNVRKIAHWIGASDEVLEDCSKVAARIDFHLTTGLLVERDRQLIAGSGSAGELLGLLTQPGLLTLNGTTLASGAGVVAPNIWDKLYLAKLELEQNCARVDGVIINPADRAKVALAKDDQGNYLFANSMNSDVDMVGSLSIKISPDVPVGTAIMGEFRNNWVWYVRKALTVSVGMKNDDFVRNMKTFLAELRGAVVVFCPQKISIITNI